MIMKVFISLALIGAAAGAWTSICQPSTNCPTIMLGVSCKDKDLCAIGGGFSNTPEAVYYSKDEFATYTLATDKVNPLLLMDIAIDAQGNGAAAGTGLLGSGFLYTSDVTEWSGSTDIDTIEGQDLKSMGNGDFGFTGSDGNTQGIFMSVDGGKDWKFNKWGASLTNQTEIRYSSFPSPKVIYTTGGHWPSTKSKAELFNNTNCVRLGENVCQLTNNKVWIERTDHRVEGASEYFGLISKSADGGKTWTEVFSDTGHFYFNDISCIDETTCFAVAEAHAGSTPGGYIFATTDGKNFTQVFRSSKAGAGMFRVHMVSKTDIWAAGGDNGGGTFYHSTDGGKTWALDGSEVPLVGTVTGLHFVDNTLGFAVGVTVLQSSTMMKWTPP